MVYQMERGRRVVERPSGDGMVSKEKERRGWCSSLYIE